MKYRNLYDEFWNRARRLSEEEWLYHRDHPETGVWEATQRSNRLAVLDKLHGQKSSCGSLDAQPLFD